jgi:hypothetical protein
MASIGPKGVKVTEKLTTLPQKTKSFGFAGNSFNAARELDRINPQALGKI